MYICDICEATETEGGDTICPDCRTRMGEDRDRIDDAIHARARTRSLRLTRDGLIAALTTKKVA